MPKKLSYEYVCAYFKKYGYIVNDTEYKDSTTPINVTCPKGHIWKVTFGHFKGNNCRCAECRKEERRYKDDFITEVLNSNNYKLNSIFIKNQKTCINITCPNGHTYNTSFEQFLNSGKRCRKCSGSNKYTIQDVKKYAKQYCYEILTNTYKDNKTHLSFKCPNNHLFLMRFDHFRAGTRCPYCRESKGEKSIMKYLEENNINYIRQYRYENCKDDKPLPFDFYLPYYNTCIEYDGELHYKSIDFYGGQIELEKQKKRDNIKTQYCKDNNIKLIRIPYWEFKNIEIILNEIYE